MASAHDGSRHPIMSVGFVGMYPGALDLVNTIVDADLFHCDSLEGMDVTDAHEPFHVQAQRMADQHMVCMFLDAVMDMSALMQLHAGIVASGPSVGGFEAFLEGRQCQLTRALLLLFSVCHVVIFVHKVCELWTFTGHLCAVPLCFLTSPPCVASVPVVPYPVSR